MNTLLLNTGARMPMVGLGTFLAPPGEVGAAVKTALENGYKHIDCAALYQNEKEVGEAINGYLKEQENKEGGTKRKDIFVTSKLAASRCRPEEVELGLRDSLSDLGLDYLDLYLIHQPISVVPNPDYDGKDRIGKFIHAPHLSGWGMQDVWREMEKCYEKGLVKAIGVSNFNGQMLNDMLTYAKVPPAVNQIERHPYLQQNNFVEFTKKCGMQTTAYAPLGAPGLFSKQETPLLQNDVILSIAEAHKKTPAQILIRWAVDSETIVIPKSQKPHRVKENFDVFDFQLSEDEVKKIKELDSGRRLFAQDWMGVPCFE